jgi:hypothetical protein
MPQSTACSAGDIAKLTRDTLVLLHNFSSKLVHGVYLAREWGVRLDEVLPQEWCYQVRGGVHEEEMRLSPVCH